MENKEPSTIERPLVLDDEDIARFMFYKAGPEVAPYDKVETPPVVCDDNIPDLVPCDDNVPDLVPCDENADNPNPKTFVMHPMQAVYRDGHDHDSSRYVHLKKMLAALWIRPQHDTDKQEYFCNDADRLYLANMLAHESRARQVWGSDLGELATMRRIRTVKIDEFIDYFLLRPLLETKRCFVAGGALLRLFMNENKKDFRGMYQEKDIDIFFRSEEDVSTYFYFLRSKNVKIEKVEGKHHCYRITCPIPYWTAPFLLQFTKTSANTIHDLIEDFDLPFCQLGVGHDIRLEYSIGFEVWWTSPQSQVHVCCSRDKRDEYQKRLDKYEAMGFLIKRVTERSYYGRRPWTMEYMGTQQVTFADGAVNALLLMALSEAYLASMNETHCKFLNAIVVAELAKKETHVRELVQNDKNYPAPKPDDTPFESDRKRRAIAHRVPNIMQENAEKEFLPKNAFLAYTPVEGSQEYRDFGNAVHKKAKTLFV